MGLEIGFAVGTLIVFVALAYGVYQYNRRDPANEARTEAATRKNYSTGGSTASSAKHTGSA